MRRRWGAKLLGAKGIATRNKKLLGAPGRTCRSKDATRSKKLLGARGPVGGSFWTRQQVRSLARTGCVRFTSGASLVQKAPPSVPS